MAIIAMMLERRNGIGIRKFPPARGLGRGARSGRQANTEQSQRSCQAMVACEPLIRNGSQT
jgi:hypothetical protein